MPGMVDMKGVYGILVEEKLRKRDHFEDPDVDGRIILNGYSRSEKIHGLDYSGSI
jgi:hypothetical protein